MIATAVAGGLTIDDLAQLALAYALPFGSAKDIVNLAGFAACNTRDGLVKPIDALPDDPAWQIVDVRPPALVQAHPIPHAGMINLPLTTLRAGLAVGISPDSGFKYTSYFTDILGDEGLPTG